MLYIVYLAQIGGIFFCTVNLLITFFPIVYHHKTCVSFFCLLSEILVHCIENYDGGGFIFMLLIKVITTRTQT